MTIGSPLPLLPRLDPKPWGGRALARFGFALPPDDAIGEALLTAAEAIIAAGPRAGETLGAVIAADPPGALGARALRITGGLPRFPLLIKLIDARDDLSIQVHPDDAHAPSGELGKTEAWHVLAAEPGACLYLGLMSGVTTDDLAALARAGASTSHLMRQVPAVPGTTVLLPAGTVHALGAGVVIYEIQQPSAVTYRFDDWGRVDAHGRSRELHIEQGLATLNPGVRPEPLSPEVLPIEAGRRERLVACDHFALERLQLERDQAVRLDGAGAPWALTCLAGTARVQTAGGEAELSAGETAALLGTAGMTTVTAGPAGATLLRGWLDPGR